MDEGQRLALYRTTLLYDVCHVSEAVVLLGRSRQEESEATEADRTEVSQIVVELARDLQRRLSTLPAELYYRHSSARVYRLSDLAREQCEEVDGSTYMRLDELYDEYRRTALNFTANSVFVEEEFPDTVTRRLRSQYTFSVFVAEHLVHVDLQIIPVEEKFYSGLSEVDSPTPHVQVLQPTKLEMRFDPKTELLEDFYIRTEHLLLAEQYLIPSHSRQIPLDCRRGKLIATLLQQPRYTERLIQARNNVLNSYMPKTANNSSAML